jgi:hypothetical protein
MLDDLVRTGLRRSEPIREVGGKYRHLLRCTLPYAVPVLNAVASKAALSPRQLAAKLLKKLSSGGFKWPFQKV